MKNDLSLTLPKSKLQPPPKKSEVIDALTKLQMEQDLKEQQTQVAQRKALEEETSAELITYAFKNFATIAKDARFGYAYSKSEKLAGVSVHLDFEQDDLSRALIDKIRKIHSLPERVREFSFTEMRKIVSASINEMMPRDERVNALLTDETSRKSLEAMLQALDA